ncbi:hypothetical protein KDL44_01020 [bacterium]|nr:hypothetical protein [bacterium]
MDSMGDSDSKQLQHAWARLRRRPMLWGWILQGLGILSSFVIMPALNHLTKQGRVSEEVFGSLIGFQLEFNVFTWYLLLGLSCYLALDRIRFLGAGGAGTDNPGGQAGLLRRYRAEISSIWHLVGLLILPSILIGLLYYTPIGIKQGIASFGVFHAGLSQFLLLVVNWLNIVILVLIMLGLSLLVDRLGILRCAALCVLADLLIGKLDRFISFRLQLLSTDLTGHNTVANPQALELGGLYALDIGSLIVQATLISGLLWMLARVSAAGGAPRNLSPLPTDA